MRKSFLESGVPIFVVKIESYVSASVFITSLTDYYYVNQLEFDTRLSKREAVKILKRQLFTYGVQGEHMDGFFEAANDVWPLYEAIQKQARDWVQKNYPYLIKEK